jgi:hypothetical protein
VKSKKENFRHIFSPTEIDKFGGDLAPQFQG